MAGFREFLTGEVLTAANVNSFLMKQSVMVFADAAARTTALGAEVTEGMLTFNKDTGALEVFDGTNFVPAGAEPNLVEVKSAIKTNTQVSAGVASGSHIAISGFEISHAVADAANKVVLIAQIVGSNDIDILDAALTADGTQIGIGAADGSRTRIGAGNRSGEASTLNSVILATVHTPGSTSSVDYGADIINARTATSTLFVNRSRTDANDAKAQRGACTLTLLEVKV